MRPPTGPATVTEDTCAELVTYTVPGPEITAASSGPGTPGCPSDARCQLVATEKYPLSAATQV